MKTKIEWATRSWNPISGCSKISAGCKNCYAEKFAKRLHGRGGYPDKNPFQITLHPDKLDAPRKWRDPAKVFVCSMGDIFHPAVPWHWRKSVLKVIKECPKHTFLILTKRPDGGAGHDFPPNVWFGTSTEDQETYDQRWAWVNTITASVRFVSMEPLLGPINILTHPSGKLPDWIIIGAEQGNPKRPMADRWALDIIRQAVKVGIPVFFKKNSDGKTLLAGQWFREYPDGPQKSAGSLIRAAEGNARQDKGQPASIGNSHE